MFCGQHGDGYRALWVWLVVEAEALWPQGDKSVARICVYSDESQSTASSLLEEVWCNQHTARWLWGTLKNGTMSGSASLREGLFLSSYRPSNTCCHNHIRAEVSLTSCEKKADGQPSCHPDFWGPLHSGRPLVAGGHKCLPPSARCERNITYLSPTPPGCQTPAVSVLWLQQMSFKAVAEHFWISTHFRIGYSSTSTFPLLISPDKEFICEYPISKSHFRGINSRATTGINDFVSQGTVKLGH